MPAVPWWAVLSSVAAPVLLAVGWTVAAVRQPPGYDPLTDTVSALSSYGPTDRLIMTVCLAGLGVTYLVTALGLRFAAVAGRLMLGCGGLATVLVSLFPKPVNGTPPAHGIAATVAFVALGLWPAAATLYHPRDAGGRAAAVLRARIRGPAADAGRARSALGGRLEDGRPWAVRVPVALTASALMLGLAGWLALQLPDGLWTGLAERMVAVAQALWPLIVVISVRRTARRSGWPDAARRCTG